MSSPYFRSAEAEYYAQNPGAYQEKLDRDQKTQRMLNVGRLGAGAIDFFGGRRDVKAAETELDSLTGQADTIQEELGSMRAPGSMDSNTVAEATRNAAILGFQTPAADPADDLAAQRFQGHGRWRRRALRSSGIEDSGTPVRRCGRSHGARGSLGGAVPFL